MKKLCLFLLFSISNLLWGQVSEAKGAFHFNPFKLTKDSEISAARLNSPITNNSRITLSADGHLQVDGKRIRIFGTNLSEFPYSKKQAEFSAQSLANQGYNCIRFHHTDANWTNCFLTKQSDGKWVINKSRLDAFDYFFYQLKLNGIYSNINLLTGRSISSADGYPSEINDKPWKAIHCLGFWNENAKQKQKDYALELLSHVNPYTGLSYLEDPAVAIIEVNNENGLLMGYLDGNIDRFIGGTLYQELENKWNNWLADKNMDYNILAAKYNKNASSKEVLVDDHNWWNLEKHNGAVASVTKADGIHTIKIEKNGTESWHIQYGVSGLNISSKEVYTLRFAAKASSPCDISIGISQAHEPWKGSSFNQKLSLTTKYQQFEFTVSNIMDDSNLRVIFSNMGFLAGKTISIYDLTFEKGGTIEYVERGGEYKNPKIKNSVKLPSKEKYISCPDGYKNLVMNFLWETEKAYWNDMKNYIRNNLGSKALIMGTAMGCSSTYLQECFDIIDSHAYWNHPVFPENDWDMNYYYVGNKDLTLADGDSTLTSLAQYRVYGKPFSVSEYDHPYPNQFSSEAYPMIASFASFQDWDCIFTFCSELPKTSDGQKQKINGYFDQTNNPSKSCAAPLASRIFRNFLVKPGIKKVYVPLSMQQEKDNLYKQNAWAIGSMDKYGVDRNLCYQYQLGYAINGKIPSNGVHFSSINNIMKTGFTDTKEIYWDKGIFMVCNDNVSLSVYHEKGDYEKYIPSFWVNGDRLLPLISTEDFGTFCAVKENDQYLIFANSWSGNKGENLKEYGKKSSTSALQIIRSNIKLTTNAYLGTGPVYALGTSGTFMTANPEITHQLYKCNLNGNAAAQIGNGSQFTIKATDGTLWYILK